MADFLFLHGKKHLPAQASAIARRHAAELVNFVDPVTGERRHWFVATSGGKANDEQLATVLKAELLAGGIRVDRAH